jgi:hypothetical protein
MKGLQILLQSLGIKIEPAQIEEAFQKGKTALPELAKSFEEINQRLSRMEAKMELLLSRTSGEVQPDIKHESELAGVSASELHNAFLNGAPELVTRDA